MKGRAAPGGSVPLAVVRPPGSGPRNIDFKFEASPAQLNKLQSDVAKIRNGATCDQVMAIMGPPSRQELTSHKEKPNDITGRLYYYDVRIVQPGIANVFDQQLVLNFDYPDCELRQVMSSVPEIK